MRPREVSKKRLSNFVRFKTARSIAHSENKYNKSSKSLTYCNEGVFFRQRTVAQRLSKFLTTKEGHERWNT